MKTSSVRTWCVLAGILVLAMAGSLSAAVQIVHWGPSAVYVTADQKLNFTNFTNGSGDFDGQGDAPDSQKYVAFSEATQLNPTSSGYSGTNSRFYGGMDYILFDTPWTGSDPNSAPFSGVRNVNPGSGFDYISQSMGGYGNAGIYAGILWEKADFLDLTASAVGLDSASTLKVDMYSLAVATVRLLVKDGSTFYVSQSSRSASGILTIADPTAVNWAPLNTNGSDQMHNWTIGAYAPHTFADVQAIGNYGSGTGTTVSGSPAMVRVREFQAFAVAVPEPMTLVLLSSGLIGLALRRRS